MSSCSAFLNSREVAARTGLTAPRRAFTLIELLVVVAIIVVLIAIMLPVLSNARQQAYKAQCANNIRGQAMAFAAYASDSLGQCPFPNWDAMDGSYKGPGWLYQAPMIKDGNGVPVLSNLATGTFWPYLNNYKFYRCPIDLPPYTHGPTQNFTSYIMNGDIVGYNSKQPWARYHLFKPDAVMIWEMDEVAMTSLAFNDGSTRPSSGATRRHGSGLTVGLASGAAEWFTRDYYYQEESNHPGREWASPFSSSGQ